MSFTAERKITVGFTVAILALACDIVLAYYLLQSAQGNEIIDPAKLLLTIAGISVPVIVISISLLISIHRELHKRLVSQNVTRKRSERLVAVLETFSDITSSDLSATRVTNLIAKRLHTITSADGIAIQSPGSPQIISPSEAFPTARIHKALALLTPAIERAMRTGRLFRCDNPETDPRVDKEIPKKAGVGSMVFAPLKGAGATFGALVALWSKPNGPSDENVEVVQHMSHLLATCLARARESERRAKAEETMESARKDLGRITADRDQTFNELQKVKAERDEALENLEDLEVEVETTTATRIRELEDASEQLRQGQLFVRTMIENLVEGVIACDASGNVTLFNRTARRWYGLESDKLPSREWVDQFFAEGLDAPVDGSSPALSLERTLGGERVRAIEAVITPETDAQRIVLVNGDPLLDQAGNRLGAVIVMHDITERKRFEERMQEQESLLDISHDAIVVRNREHRILFWNKGAEQLYGWSDIEALGRKAHELHSNPTPAYEEAKRIVLEKGEWSGELQQVTKDGKEIIVQSRWALERDERGEPKSILVIDSDITEQKKLEQQFLRAQRMESIGTLAGGIAHDLNNVLTPILLSINVLRKKLSDEHSQKIIQLLDSSARRGAGMVKQVLTFARGVEGERGILQPKHLIREMESIAGETFPKAIKISVNIPKNLWTIQGDATQIHQVLLNLCVNARDAMPGGGELIINAENVTFDESTPKMHPDAKEGPYVLISVSDTGTGIPSEILERIFDPFFTTKEQGKGTGLGLSTTLGIIEAHGGFILVDTEVGRGTTFKVYLPAVEETEAQQGAKAIMDIPHARGESVLVIDDELTIREITKTTLETFGYRVLTATNGKDALDLFALNKNEIKVVVCDMMMPVMDGAATIRSIQELRPDVAIVAVTGSTGEGRALFSTLQGRISLLLKPYSSEKLLTTLQETLSAGQHS